MEGDHRVQDSTAASANWEAGGVKIPPLLMGTGVLRGTHSTFVQMTRTQLLPSLLATCSRSDVMQFGKVCLSTQEHAPQKMLACSYTKHVLTGQPVSTLRPSSGWLCQKKCVQAFLRFKMSSHSLPCITTTGRVADIPTAHLVCTLCQNGNLGVEQHLVFVCPALQGVRDNRMVYLMIMPLRWFKACGSTTIVLLRNLSKKCGRTQ